MPLPYDEDAARALALAEQLAAEMPGWVACPRERDYGWPRLCRADGAAILVRWGGWHAKGRVSFSPQWPKYADGRQMSTPARYTPTKYETKDSYSARRDAEDWSITVSQGRSTKQMAKEICRRLLPPYETMYAIALAEVASADVNTEEAAIVARRLASIVDGWIDPRTLRTGEEVHIRASPAAVHRMKVSPQCDGVVSTYPCRVSFEVHDLDPETAAQVLDLIQSRPTTASGAVRIALMPNNAQSAGDDGSDEGREVVARLRRHLMAR